MIINFDNPQKLLGLFQNHESRQHRRMKQKRAVLTTERFQDPQNKQTQARSAQKKNTGGKAHGGHPSEWLRTPASQGKWLFFC